MSLRRLLAAAAILHVSLALTLFVAGRARFAPAVIDSNGLIDRGAHDSYIYLDATMPLVEALQRGDVAAWARTRAPAHTRLLAACFVALGPLVGYSALAAEPYNLGCYLAVVALVFSLARAVGGQRAGAIAGVVVALWPTFLFHTLQLLKDALFIAGALGLILVAVTWLTAEYDFRRAARAVAIVLVAAALTVVVRPQFVAFVTALVGFALVLLAVRQYARRALHWPNLASALAAFSLLAVAAVVLSQPAPPLGVAKRASAPDVGAPKAATVTTVSTASVRSAPRRGVNGAADRATHVLGSVRGRFNYENRKAGSGIDDAVEFLGIDDLVAYVPRAAVVGLWAPFPHTWARSGMNVGRSGRLLAGVETLGIYVCQVLALVALARGPRRTAAWFLLVIAVGGVTGEALVVSNLGALFRFRYAFWCLFIVLAAVGIDQLRQSRRWPSRRGTAAVLAMLLAVCSTSCTTPPPSGVMRINNVSGLRLRAVHLSPSQARTWQENLLGEAILDGGRTLDVTLGHDASVVTWDLLVDGGPEFVGAWRGLDLSNVSTLTLRVAGGQLIADLEDAR